MRPLLFMLFLLGGGALLALLFWNHRQEVSRWIAVNKVYHLGHRREWDQAEKMARPLREQLPDSPRLARMTMHIMLYQARPAEAWEFYCAFVRSRKNGAFPELDRLALFALLLQNRTEECRLFFEDHWPQDEARKKCFFLQEQWPDNRDRNEHFNKCRQALDREMLFPELYQGALTFLEARICRTKGLEEEATRLLLPLTRHFPRHFLFQSELAELYLDLGRHDLAGVHGAIAWKDLRNDPEGRKKLKKRFLKKTREQAATVREDVFWRYLRSLYHLVPEIVIEHNISASPPATKLADLHEWRQLKKMEGQKNLEDAQNLSTETRHLLDAMSSLTLNLTDSPSSLTLPALTRNDGTTLTRRMILQPLDQQFYNLVEEDDLFPFTLPPIPNNWQDGALLLRLKATRRQGLPGGCEIWLGRDRYACIPPDDYALFAFPMPRMMQVSIPFTCQFHYDFIHGFTDVGDSGDRNIYIHGIYLLGLEETNYNSKN